jgi:apolipoprotein N-acyltransferase
VLKTITAIALSAIAFYFGNGLHPHWWMMWIAAVPVLVFSYHSSARASLLVAFMAYLIGYLNLWTYFKVLEVPLVVRLIAFLGTSLIFAAGVLLSRTFFLRERRILAIFALPVVWESFEFASSWGRNGTALNIAYSQMDCLPLLQLACITGIWGIGFLLFFFSSAIAQIIYLRRLSRDTLIPLTVTIAILTFGFWRLQSAVDGSEIRIGLAASDQRPLLGPENKATAITDSYVKAIGDLAREGASVVVLPEKILTTDDYPTGEFYRRIRVAALSNSVVVVAGVNQTGAPLKHNLAFVVSPSFEADYEKHHMVVGWEDGYEIGRNTLMLPAFNNAPGIAICKDMDFPRLSRTYGQLGAQLMLVPAWDFEIDDWLHGRMAVMRSVESGFAMARSAKQGFMTINDNRGRVLAQARSDATGSALLLGSVKLSSERTLYTRFGDWFAWLNLATLVALLACLSLSTRRLITDGSRPITDDQNERARPYGRALALSKPINSQINRLTPLSLRI